MIDVTGDLWEYGRLCDAVVITTNTFVKKNGEAVMGRGCALEAKRRHPWLPRRLGEEILRDHAPNVRMFSTSPEQGVRKPLVTFQVKMHWRDSANLRLIETSAKELVELTDREGWSRVVMPRPGCGNGNLEWSDVRPVIAPILDDRFHIITWRGK